MICLYFCFTDKNAKQVSQGVDTNLLASDNLFVLTKENNMTSISRRNFLVGSTALACSLPTVAAESKNKFDDSADVVVVGLGGAGAAAAITASDHKASVIILEKQPLATLRSNTRMSGGWVHCPEKDGNKEELRKYFRALFSAKYDDKPSVGEEDDISNGMAEYWVEYTPNLMDWLKSLDPELKGQKFSGPAQYVNFPGAKTSSYASYHLMYPARMGKASSYNGPKSEATEGEALWRALEKGIQDRSSLIKVIDNAPAVSLILNKDGHVVGVVAKKDGKDIRIQAKKGVILASGGYEYSAEMRKAFLPGPSVGGFAFYGTPYNEGEGIRMGIKAGAALSKVSTCAARMIWAPPVYHNGMRLGVTTVGVGAPGSFVVNALGDRFIAENKIMGGITNNSVYEKAAEQNLDTMTYDNMPAWQIFEEKIFKSRPLANLTRSTVGYGFIDYGSADNSDALKKGWILKADSIEELAKKIAETSVNKGRMNPQKLADTLKRFNEMSTEGKDEDFERNPKSLKALEGTVFYAIPLFAGGSNTKGGLKTNPEHQVLDWDGKPIKGLYAAGEIACGLNRGGAMLTDALVFGQVTGRAVVTKK